MHYLRISTYSELPSPPVTASAAATTTTFLIDCLSLSVCVCVVSFPFPFPFCSLLPPSPSAPSAAASDGRTDGWMDEERESFPEPFGVVLLSFFLPVSCAAIKPLSSYPSCRCKSHSLCSFSLSLALDRRSFGGALLSLSLSLSYNIQYIYIERETLSSVGKCRSSLSLSLSTAFTNSLRSDSRNRERIAFFFF